MHRLHEKARKRLHTANHLLTVTYPVVKDPKILLPVLENIYLAYEDGAKSLKGEDISNYSLEVEDFKELAENNDLSEIHIESFEELKAVLVSHKDSPVEFVKGEKYVICDDEYMTQVLTEERLKKYIRNARAFLTNIEVKNGRIIR